MAREVPDLFKCHLDELRADRIARLREEKILRQ